MTIGFAAAHLLDGQASFLLAADSRYSAAGAAADIAIKTYSLGSNTGAVAAGSALSVNTAAELTRSIVEDHNRLAPNAPINFYSTVRLFSYFLDHAEDEISWSLGSEVVLAGFLSNGTPALAKVVTRRLEKTEIYIYAAKQAGSLVMMVGQPHAKEQIYSAISRPFTDSGPRWLERAVATIAYLCRHEGEPTIGGAPSVAVCPRAGPMYWPFVVVEGKTYLRGFDLTASVSLRPGDDALHVRYDDAWHAESDRERSEPTIKLDEGFFSISWYLENWVTPANLFDWKVDPKELEPMPDLTLPPAVVVVVRPGEMSWLPERVTGYGGSTG